MERKIETYAPKSVGFVGVTVFREFWPKPASTKVACGLHDETVCGAAMFVLPNPSGRNAHYSYDEMLRYWRELSRWRDDHA